MLGRQYLGIFNNHFTAHKWTQETVQSVLLEKKNTMLWVYYIFSKVASSLKLKHESQLKSLKIYKAS